MNIFIDAEFEKYYRRYPLNLVDVGASGGMPKNWEKAKKFLHYIAFEPDEQAFKELRKKTDSKFTLLNTALYKEKKSVDFHVTRKQEVSSMFRPNRTLLEKFPDAERFDILRTIKVDTDTLDNQMKKEKILDIDFIKIDTQGSELTILEGSSAKTLHNVFGLEIEVEFANLYENQPLFSDVDTFVRKYGFQLFDFKPYYWKRSIGKKHGAPKGQIIFADALYLKDSHIFNDYLKQIDDKFRRKSKVLNAVSICILYGYLDYAAEVFEAQQGLFNEQEIKLFNLFLNRNIPLSSKIPGFLGRNKLSAIFGILQRFLRKNDWAFVGKSLGNL